MSGQNKSTPSGGSSKPKLKPTGLRTGRLLLIMLIVSLVLIVAVKFWPSSGGGVGGLSIPANVPKEIQVKYLPASFNFKLDEEDAVAIITNPQRYRREFNDLVRNINLAILEHVANRMNLTEEQKGQVRKEYESSHDYLRNLYYRDFMSLRDSTSTLARTWYSNEAGSATKVLEEVAAKYTCFLVNQIIATVVQTEGGSYYGKGRKIDTPCGIAIGEALNPMIKRLEQRAAIEDFSRSKGLLEQRVEKTVTELATYELQSKKGLSKQLQTKIWGFSVSSTDIEIQAISVMKFGFKLHNYFDVSLNQRNKVVTVTLPEPEILSHSVYPKLDKLDIGWLREVKGVDLNQSFDLLREEFVQEANRLNAKEKAKAHAQDVLNTMMLPVINGFDPSYKLRVRFQRVDVNKEFQPNDEFKDLDVSAN